MTTTADRPKSHDLKRATAVAAHVQALLRPLCSRIAIAGSVRRLSQHPHDVELVLQIAPGQDLAFDFLLAGLAADGTLAPDPDHIRDGPRYKRRLYRKQMPVDLFIVRPPAEWGLILFIRTGPAHFVKAAVTRWTAISRGHSRDGALYDGSGIHHPTPDERAVFNALRLPEIEPRLRDDARL
jgi:DNA polymerase/3'-5' exonuclease PolX